MFELNKQENFVCTSVLQSNKYKIQVSGIYQKRFQ